MLRSALLMVTSPKRSFGARNSPACLRPRMKFAGRPPAQVNPALSNKIKDTMRRVASAQAQLKRVNDAHQCLLRKSRRNVQVLVNLFQAYAPGYSVEATRGTGTLCEERV